MPELPPASNSEAPTPLFREPWERAALSPAAEYEPPALAWPEPDYAALPAPEPERLSSPEEINAFLETAWATPAPEIEMEIAVEPEMTALPPPDEK